MLLATVLVTVLVGQVGTATPADLHLKVAATYDFAPHTLDDTTIENKSSLLDAFWAGVKADGSSGLAALRAELIRTDNPTFFYYDGAKLLLSLSSTRSDKQLALNAMVRADLRDVQATDYFYTIHSFATDDGLDTCSAALKLLDDPKWKIFIPQHALTLVQNYSLLYLLLPLDEAHYVDRAIQRLNTETELTAFRSLLLLLAYTITRQGDSAIVNFAADHSKPSNARAYAKELVTLLDLSGSPVQAAPSKRVLSLKAERRSLMRRVSDEALIELDALSRKIRRAARS